jgi:hypothetical protein
MDCGERGACPRAFPAGRASRSWNSCGERSKAAATTRLLVTERLLWSEAPATRRQWWGRQGHADDGAVHTVGNARA